ncbi:MAG: hypothetical protein IJL59_03465 [Clostridia bacterium]|nr:hypothetical protein [Clostridia bacterium]MBQ9189520.1 hypothetical protein [Clostridia bacterium]MBR3272086.1 hypothetical protein [Clostridia bacterium]
MSMNEEQLIRRDRMRFTKNTLSSGLALLAILLNVLYFVSIYKSDVGSYYYNILIGASVLYNLVFMLVVFLSSEGVKGYKIGYAYVLIVVGLLQIVRIFILPMRAHTATVTINQQETIVMQTAQFIRVIVYLCASSVCCIVAGIVGIQKSRTLSAYMATLNQKAA